MTTNLIIGDIVERKIIKHVMTNISTNQRQRRLEKTLHISANHTKVCINKIYIHFIKK